MSKLLNPFQPGAGLEPLNNRRSIRLKQYDYSKPGAYFVTICTKNRECLFGQIVGATPRGCPNESCACPEMNLNNAGEMIQKIWNEIPQFYGGVKIDAFQIMPNHVHGIIIIDRFIGQAQGPAPTTLSLPDIVHRFKTMTTKKYIDGINQNLWQTFDGKLWQRNYYEHVIRNEDELREVREYIINNQIKWDEDRNNPLNLQLCT